MSIAKDPPPLEPVQLTATSGQHTLRVLALGEPVVYINDTPITRWRMARAMELFFFLLDYGRPVHKEQIIATLWPEPDDQIDQTLRSTVYYLRQALGKPCVVYRAGTYALDLATSYPGQVWYDVAIFQERYAAAKKALAASNDTTARAAFMDMINLYRGDYVQSFYSDWGTTRREELRRAYMDARRHLALIAWHHEQIDECITQWQHLLAIDNCLEEAHYGLMRCYLRQGKRSLALRQYQRCATLLHDELAVTPGPAIQQLYRYLIGGASVGDRMK
jgi:LuxR family maltose regulon positive regulatory protein